jgi:A118 family predicted phage portal protein
MPLPPGGPVAWPPRDLDAVTSQIAVWSAWYGSDLDQLSAIYGGTIAGDPARPSGWLDPTRGGIRGRLGSTLARWFWGGRTPDGEKRTKLHLPVARDIAVTSASLLMGEGPTFKADDDATQQRLDKLTGRSLRATLTEAAEVDAGLGGAYLRIVWDQEVRDHPWLDVVHADSAIPEWRWNALSAATFWREVERDGQRVVRHLERHEPGWILHGLYEGTDTQLGAKLKLAANKATMHLPEAVPTGTQRLTAVYIPNVRPAPGWRRVPAAANLGRADFDGVEPFMDALDEVWSSWMRDIRLGKARLHVPATYLTNLGPGRGAAFEDRELYTPVEGVLPGIDQGLQINATQFAIRVQEHRDTCLELTKQIVSMSGYSAQTYGLDGDGAPATATEVTARERKSFTTRDKKINYWSPELSEILETLIEIDAKLFNGGGQPGDIDVEFGDGVSEAPRTVAETLNLLSQAQAASTDTLVRMLHPDWDDARVEAEVQEIRDATSLVDPTTFTGGGGLGQDQPADPEQQATPPADQPPTPES